MLDDNEPAAIILRLDNSTMAYACHATGENCACCKDHLTAIPAMLLYRPQLELYEPVCRECAIIICRAARIRIGAGDNGG